jgi:hypothetical protein
MINAWEENGAMLIGLANELKEAEKLTGLEREDAIYTLLAKCAAYAEGADTTMEGVDVAMKVYNRVLGEYVAETNATNNIIENTDKVAFATGTKAIAATVISILIGIVKN